MLPEDLALLPTRGKFHLENFEFLKAQRENDRYHLPPETKSNTIVIAKLSAIAFETNDSNYIRLWVTHCLNTGISLTGLAFASFNASLNEDNRPRRLGGTTYWRTHKLPSEWHRHTLPGLFEELSRLGLPCNPVVRSLEKPLLHAVAVAIIMSLRKAGPGALGRLVNLEETSGPGSGLSVDLRDDLEIMCFTAVSIIEYGGDLYVRDDENYSVTDIFRDSGFLWVWEVVLAVAGLIPELVLEEDGRRKEGISVVTTHDFCRRSEDTRQLKSMHRKTFRHCEDI